MRNIIVLISLLRDLELVDDLGYILWRVCSLKVAMVLSVDIIDADFYA